MKKAISLVCAFSLLLSAFCVGGLSFAAAETLQEGDYEYEILSEYEAKIIGYHGNEIADIPSWINGYDVVAIGSDAFAGHHLNTLTIPLSIMHIEANAFADCTIDSALYSGWVYAWSTLDIGDGNDELLDKVRLHHDGGLILSLGRERRELTIVGYEHPYAYNSYSLDIPSAIDDIPITAIASDAFRGANIEYFMITSTLKCIEDDAFLDCSIDFAFFAGSAREWNELRRNIGLNNDAVVNVMRLYHEESRFYYTVETDRDGNDTVTILGYEGTDFYPTVPSDIDGFSVTTIGENVFMNAYLDYVVLPSSIRCIEDNAFAYSTLRRAYFEGTIEEWNMVEVGNGNQLFLQALAIRDDSNLLFSVESGTAIIKGYEGYTSDLQIPSEIHGYPVTMIYYEAFMGQVFETVTLPSSIQHIQSRAFADCYIGRAYYNGDLEGWISGVLVEPENYALEQAMRFREGDYTVSPYSQDFYGITILDYHGTNTDTIEIPPYFANISVRGIGPEAFKDKTIGTITFPEELEWISENAFMGSTVHRAYLSGYPMREWYNLRIDYGNESLYPAMVYYYDWYAYTVDNGNATLIGTPPMYDPPSAFDIPDNLGGYPVTSIGEEAFYGRWVDTVTIPATVTRIEPRAFESCGLYRAYYAGSPEEWANVSVDPDNQSLLWAMTFRENGFWYQTGYNGTAVIVGCDEYDSILHLTIPAKLGGCPVTEIYYDVLEVFPWLESIYLPATITDLDCSRWPSSLYTIYYAGSESDRNNIYFGYDSDPEKYKWVYNAVSHGDYNGFTYCVKTDDTVTILRYGGLASDVTIPSTIEGYPVTAIDDYAFATDWDLRSVTIPSSVKTIGMGAFEYCQSLESVVLEDGLTTIEDYAFIGCGLREIDIPDSVISIAPCAFEDTAYYQDEANWDNYGLYIGNVLIKAKDVKVDRFTVRNGTRLIADEAFGSGIMTIAMPQSVTAIGSNAFNVGSTSALNGIYYGGTQDDWKAISFGENADVSDRVMMHYTEAEEPILGDADGDGEISTSDCRVALACALGDNPTEEELALLDMNHDGKISTKDVRIMMLAALAV